MAFNTRAGTVAADGRFEFKLRGRVDRTVIGTFPGKLEGKSGKGTYRFGRGWTGSITLTRS